jgi:putative intracellular protease/amidase
MDRPRAEAIETGRHEAMMKCGVLYFDGFCEFEVVIACGILAQKAEIIGIALEQRPFVSEEKQIFLPTALVGELTADDLNVLLVPGGDVTPLLDNPELKKLIVDLNARGRLIAGICGGAILLGSFGILDGRRFTGSARGYEFDEEALGRHFSRAEYAGGDVVIDGNVVTGMGQAYVEFGVAVGERAGIYSGDEEKQHDLCWLKNL